MAANRKPGMKYRKLGNTDMTVSVLSFGASSLGSVFRETDASESVAVTRRAIDAGINYIDTAAWYGHGRSESVLGQALSGVPRDQYYLATKLGRYLPAVDQQFDFSAERTLREIDNTLARLRLPYVDVIQVHDMEFAPSLDVILNETLPALDKIRAQGKARYVGITGYPLGNFRTVLERSPVPIDTVLSYCHLTLNDTSLMGELPFYRARGVGLVNASPIAMGLLSSRGPPAWHPAMPDVKEACAAAARYCEAEGVDLSKLALHFTLSHEDIPTTLVSTASLSNLEKNIAAVTSQLSEKEQQVMQDVIDKYMKPLENMHWEGIEVAQYREDLCKIQAAN